MRNYKHLRMSSSTQNANLFQPNPTKRSSNASHSGCGRPNLRSATELCWCLQRSTTYGSYPGAQRTSYGVSERSHRAESVAAWPCGQSRAWNGWKCAPVRKRSAFENGHSFSFGTSERMGLGAVGVRVDSNAGTTNAQRVASGHIADRDRPVEADASIMGMLLELDWRIGLEMDALDWSGKSAALESVGGSTNALSFSYMCSEGMRSTSAMSTWPLGPLRRATFRR